MTAKYRTLGVALTRERAAEVEEYARERGKFVSHVIRRALDRESQAGFCPGSRRRAGDRPA